MRALLPLAAVLFVVGCSAPAPSPAQCANEPFQPLQFGPIAVGQNEVLPLEVRNPSSERARILVTSAQGAFGVGGDGGLPQLEIRVDGGAAVTVPVIFRPTAPGEHLSEISVTAPDGCGKAQRQQLQVRGVALEDALSWTPYASCGWVPPGAEAHATITFTNQSRLPIALTELRTANDSEFQVGPTQGLVPAASMDASGAWRPGTLEVEVEFVPVAGLRQTQLTFSTDLVGFPDESIPLQCFGGGPDIEVTPMNLSFGKVAYFEGSPQTKARTLTLRNGGTEPATPDIDARLRIERIEVIPLNGTTSSGEFVVQWRDEARAGTGLPSSGELADAELDVLLTPGSIGAKDALVRVHSNDPDEEVTDVHVTAEVVALPPCDFTVGPDLEFGLVEPGANRTLRVSITNRGTLPSDVCVFSNLALQGASVFSVPAGLPHTVELGPSEAFTLGVQMDAPAGSPALTEFVGALTFEASSPLKHLSSIPLTGMSGPSCLTIAPQALDFGTLEQTCQSAMKTVNVWSNCPTPVNVQSYEWINCGSPGGCGEFKIVAAPSVPQLLATDTAPLSFSIRYGPVDSGTDEAWLALRAIQDGTPVTYLLRSTGEGGMNVRQTDSFVVARRPVDFLFVVDQGPGMVAHQSALAAEVPSFVSQASANSVDLQAAVTTPDLSMNGTFVVGPGHPEGVVSSSDPFAAQRLAQKVQVGSVDAGGESCLWAVMKVLSTSNALVRWDADLVIVCISDELDAWSGSTAYWLNSVYGVKGYNNKASVHIAAVNGFTPACPIDDGTLASIASLERDICSVSWSGFLSDLLAPVSGPLRTFDLRSPPDEAALPIEVTLDGQPLLSTEFTYDVNRNAIALDPGVTLSPGQVVEVTYIQRCFP